MNRIESFTITPKYLTVQELQLHNYDVCIYFDFIKTTYGETTIQ